MIVQFSNRYQQSLRVKKIWRTLIFIYSGLDFTNCGSSREDPRFVCKDTTSCFLQRADHAMSNLTDILALDFSDNYFSTDLRSQLN
jgi:hypothetical protein